MWCLSHWTTGEVPGNHALIYHHITLYQLGGPLAWRWGREHRQGGGWERHLGAWKPPYLTVIPAHSQRGSRATLQGSISRLRPISSACSQLHGWPSFLRAGTHSKCKCDWTLEAASLSVPDMLASRFCLSWLPAPLALGLGREVLVEFCLAAPPFSIREFRPLRAVNRRLMGSFLTWTRLCRNDSQMGRPSIWKADVFFYRGLGREKSLNGRMQIIILNQWSFQSCFLKSLKKIEWKSRCQPREPAISSSLPSLCGREQHCEDLLSHCNFP